MVTTDHNSQQYSLLTHVHPQPPCVQQTQVFVVNDHPIKFFIQRDLPPEIHNSLVEAINAEGGIIEAKVPIKGYVLIQPGSQDAIRLQSIWLRPERPERHFVPYTWVDASRRKGKPLSQIFSPNGFSIRIHIHKSIANFQSRDALAETIANHGGDPTASEEDASVILAASELESFREMRKELQGNTTKFIENIKWLQTCVDQELYYHSPNPVKNPGGRRPGDERTAFTDEDEANLCSWIASVIPFKESGGRTGNKIYIELVSRANLPGYEWVGRHTWQSWRERYKKNAARLDQHIAAIVNLSHTPGADKAQFGYFKLTEGKAAPSRRRKRKNRSDADEQSAEIPESTDNAAAGPSQMPDTQSSEWAIREGQDPTPEWAKHEPTIDMDPDGGDQKRAKTGDATYRTFVLTPASDYRMLSSKGGVQQDHLEPERSFVVPSRANFAVNFGGQGPIFPVDQAILDIAREFQFVPTEVRAFYDRTGDLAATRQRFLKMRDIVNAMP